MFRKSKTRFALKSFRAGRLLRRLARDRRAGVAMTVGLTLIPLVGTVGLSVDFSRAYLVKTRLSHAIDAAALAGGSNVDAVTLDADIRMYFDANYTPGFMGSYISDFKTQLGSDQETVFVEATSQVPTTFSRVLGFNYISVHAANMARLSVRGMELVLVMDNTGSMRSGGKMTAMKDAAKELIDILYGGRQTVRKFYVGLVPYAAMVNIGNSRTNWVRGLKLGQYAPTEWKGCVEARNAPYDQDDTPPVGPGGVKFDELLWPTTINDYAAERAANGWIGDNDWTPGPGGDVDESNAAANYGYGPNLGCGPAITPLTAAKSTIDNAIDQMQPWSRGGTQANLGLTWGWRVLSPRWRGLWGGATPPALPMDYNTPLMDKVVILLTDGVNQWYDWRDGLPGRPDNGTYPDADYTAYGRLSDGRLGTTNRAAAGTELDNRMLTACTALKDEGVTIYTITFRVTSSALRTLYEQCASTPFNYFDSPSNAELSGVFRAIGVELSNLRLQM